MRYDIEASIDNETRQIVRRSIESISIDKNVLTLDDLGINAEGIDIAGGEHVITLKIARTPGPR